LSLTIGFDKNDFFILFLPIGCTISFDYCFCYCLVSLLF